MEFGLRQWSLETDSEVWTQTVKFGNRQWSLETDSGVWTQTVKFGNRQRSLDSDSEVWKQTVEFRLRQWSLDSDNEAWTQTVEFRTQTVELGSMPADIRSHAERMFLPMFQTSTQVEHSLLYQCNKQELLVTANMLITTRRLI